MDYCCYMCTIFSGLYLLTFLFHLEHVYDETMKNQKTLKKMNIPNNLKSHLIHPNKTCEQIYRNTINDINLLNRFLEGDTTT